MKKIANSDLWVSNICLGTMTYGTPVKHDDAVALTNYAIDQGINFIDTANMYEGYTRFIGSSGGIAEEILGDALKKRREEIILATKVGMKVGEAPEDENTSPAAIHTQLSRSLERLQTDYVDIYYLHRPDPNTPITDILQALAEEIDSSRIRYYGVSNYSATELRDLLNTAKEHGYPTPIVHQPPLSLLKTDVLDDLLPLCNDSGIGAVPYQILQGGLLTGKYKRGEAVPTSSRKAEKKEWVWDLTDELFDKLEEFETRAKARNQSLMEYAINWVLEQPAVVSAIVGVKTTTQIDNLTKFL